MGRKKSKGERYACGKLRPDRSPAAIRQLVSLAEKKLVDPLFGSQIGILHLQGVISANLVSSASRFAEAMGRYDSVVGNPSRTARSPDYEMGRQEAGGENRRDLDPEAVEKIKTLRDKMTACLAGPEGSMWRAVYDTVLLDYRCGVMDQHSLIAGLQELSFLFGYEQRPQATQAA